MTILVFGVGAIPCSKWLLDDVPPTFMAAFLYLGAGAGVGLMYVFHFKKEPSDERLGKKDVPYTLAMVALDIIAPFIGVALSAIFLKESFTAMFIVALVIMIAGTVLIVRDTLIHGHSHSHTHVITHTHDGSTHMHIIEHEHGHTHVINEEKHSHTHSIKELEIVLGHSGKG